MSEYLFAPGLAPRAARAHRGTGRQRGFTLLLGTGLLLLASLVVVYLFNVGQVVSMRMRLNNAADAAAYSAAVWRARVLNFQAYANRAIVAQEVAVAQAVTLASWARYFDTLRSNAQPELVAGLPAAAALLQVDPATASEARAAAERAAALDVWLRAAPAQGYKSMLLASQQALHHSAGTFGLGALANEVARANDRHFFAFALPDEGAFEALTVPHAGDEQRERLVDLVLDSLDDFTREPRSLDRDLLASNECGAAGPPQYRKRGGTQLSEDFGRWQAADTGSIHAWSVRGAADDPVAPGVCADRERPPLGWGALVAAPAGQTDVLADDVGGLAANPVAARRARRQLRDEPPDPLPLYDGIAAVRELSPAALEQRAPVRSGLAVLARVEQRDLRTASMPAIGDRTALAGGRVWALSAAEVYFRRPALQHERVELASLYSPYWQARLVAPTPSQQRLAQGYVD